ncbi:sigma 54-interacting transcriptional regulator [Croceibacterium sp. TMG7-5b_MA50]|uniref:sigma-54 interaction domain-containing protein n=1 Tax=Croceibacterium sp. TMG7-5b_MA50 TaxID=3121290 RepID=UPI003221F389
MMSVLETTRAFDGAHAALAARLAGVASSLFPDRPVLLADAGERAAGDQPAISVQRGAVPGIELAGAGARLTYDDARSPGSLAALIALMCGRRAPVAADPASLSVLALADRIARADIPVLIAGPTGTGKEVVSRFIHDRSPRAGRPFVAVNCAAIPETMLEALLFGHQKGAFTGANAAGEGFFRAADGGTLLLDEIAEMPLALQAKLLRALQEGEVVPVGATKPIKIDVRIIACANRDLPQEVEEGRFRADLYYRLNVFPVALAALCERPADIAPLAFSMVLRHAAKGRPVPWIADEALAMLEAHGWPGNIRELENVIRRALVLAGTERAIGAQHIVFDRPARLVTTAAEPAAVAPVEPTAASKLAGIVQLSEARAILETLDACGGRRTEAARQLGISERTLRYRLASYREAGLLAAGAR